MALSMDSLPVQSKKLKIPPLQEIADVLNIGLKKHFDQVTVEVVDCPDLTAQPFGLAAKGLNGNPSLVEVGGPSYLLPLVQRNKLYDLKDVPKIAKSEPSFIIGAGAGPFKHEGVCCEGITNIFLSETEKRIESRVSKVTENGGCVLKIPEGVTEFGLLANLFVSEGKTGKVLKVHVFKRVGGLDFIASIRTTLAEHYGVNDVLGLGGAFVIKKGKAKFHVMPDFSETPINNDDEVNRWLKFYEFNPPMVALGTLTTGEFGLDLRVQHFHAFSDHNEGGHYHIDTTPDLAEYEGYFNLGETVFRVDAPPHAHAFGRD